MKRIPWKGIAVACGTLAVLVMLRCMVSAGRFLYYGGTYWQSVVMEDPWLYIGMISAALCVAALLVLAELSSQEEKENTDGDGCGD